jgi:hypothetical protein
MCCQNNYVVKNSENDLDLYKKDMAKSKANRKQKMTDYEDDEENSKFKRNKEILDRHMKDSSMKLNSSVARIESHERIQKLAALVTNKNSSILYLKVSYFSFYRKI